MFPNAENFIKSGNSMTTSTVVQKIDESLSPTGSLEVLLKMQYSIFAALSLIIIILSIIFIVKSAIVQRKIKIEISEKLIKNIKIISTILLILNILTLLGNLFAIIFSVMSIIAIIFSKKSKKIFIDDVELSKKKLNIANILNIIISVGMIISVPVAIVTMPVLAQIFNVINVLN